MRLAWTACLLLLTIAAGCARAEPPRPLLWKVSDADNSVYLLGSFHLLRPGDYPLAASTDLAFEDAESVVFELSPAEMNDPALGQLMAAAARREDGKRLQDTVSAETWARLETWAARRGVLLENLQGLDAWFVGLTISLMEMQTLGLDPKLGLDRHFARRATEAGKQTEGLETGAEQIALFDGLEPGLQQQSLEDVLRDAEQMEENINRLHDLWRRGDAEGIEAEARAVLGADEDRALEQLLAQRAHPVRVLLNELDARQRTRRDRRRQARLAGIDRPDGVGTRNAEHRTRAQTVDVAAIESLGIGPQQGNQHLVERRPGLGIGTGDPVHRVAATHGVGVRDGARRVFAHRFGNRLDMRRRGAAAAADDVQKARGGKFFDHHRHFRRGFVVFTEGIRQAGVGVGGHVGIGLGCQLFQVRA